MIGKIPIAGDLLYSTAEADTTIQNPNGASELAILMRQMQEYSNAEKVRVLKGHDPSEMPASFSTLSTAEITNGMHKSESYDAFATMYLEHVRSYSGSGPGDERVTAYNNMIASCLGCHSEHCPGPVPVIKKLMIEP